MKTVPDLQDEIRNHRSQGLTYAQVAAAYGPPVTRAVVWRIEHDGYNPRRNDLRRALGLTEYLTVEIERNGEGRFTKRTQPGA
jgi:predicted transcriptional regulator